MDSGRLGETLLPKRVALPIFCSDPLSSVAYATEEILLILALGGLAVLHLAWYAAVGIVILLVVVVASYRQTCYAYPGGGGAYVVAAENLGRTAALTAASALLIDYVMTVAVSVVSGVAAITSAVHGAWLVVLAMPVLFAGMKGVRRHYDAVAAEVAVGPHERPRALAEHHVLVLIASVNAPSLRALSYAKTLRPSSLTAVTVAEDPAEAEVLRATWEARGIDVPLRVLNSPYRSIVQPVLRHVREAPERTGDAVISVVIPEYVVGHWWEQPLHNQSALRLKARLLFMRNVVVIDVPYRLASARELAAERAREAADRK
ncbi:hypothetical protein ACFWV1_07470 [Streptomyces sp. NPDC058700]|uniref:hypothetical protein n=1 Tax=Streptomyces sp. NPDC058700 TaxID=3346607 RepID=UPI00364A25FB